MTKKKLNSYIGMEFVELNKEGEKLGTWRVIGATKNYARILIDGKYLKGEIKIKAPVFYELLENPRLLKIDANGLMALVETVQDE